jgi:DNA invertase Pin-like site-specific DNA recombinase
VTRRLLPGSPDDLRGLRARRYVRVSSDEQGTKYGPDFQHDEIDRLVARLGLVETGPAFVDEASAWSRSAERPALLELVAAATAGTFDVLAVAYFSRWSRDTEVALRIRRELHAAGVVLFFGDEWFLSSDENSHERFLQEATAAEIYSVRLSRTIRKTFAAKFERYGDQAGTRGPGFFRTPQPEARLAIDPAVMPRIVELFERYALGDVSYREVAEISGVAEGKVRAILTNPLYNGWARRHRRRPDELMQPAPWRASPPVSDALWARVSEVRAMRAKAAGRRRSRHVHLLAKLMWCPCGRVVRADTSRQKNGTIARRYVHQGCPLWSRENVVAHRLDLPIEAQLSGIRIDARTLSRIRAGAGRPIPASTDIRRMQLERDLRAKATDHAARRLSTSSYLAEHERITAEIDALEEQPGPPLGDVDEVVGALGAMRDAWRDADLEARAQLVGRVYQRIIVADGAIVEVELTEVAKRHGFLEALPETVVMARPAGLEPTTFRSAT